MDRRGVAPSPTLRPRAETPVREDPSEPQRCQRVSRTVTGEGYETKYARKGGLSYLRTNVAPSVTPQRVCSSRESASRCPVGSGPRSAGTERGGGEDFSLDPAVRVVGCAHLGRPPLPVLVGEALAGVFATPRRLRRKFAVVEFEVAPRPNQPVLFAAVVVPMADRRATVRRCCPFLTLLSPVRLAVPYTADRVARRFAGFLPFPPVTRGCRPVQDVPPELLPGFEDSL